MIIQQIEECSESATVLCICVSSVGECKVVSFVFLSIRSATLVRERGRCSFMCTLTAFQRPASSLFKKTRKFFMSFCFCVIMNPSCLQSSQLAITTVNFSRIFFENASCKRLVLALACMVGFGLASFETRFKKTHKYMHTHTHKIFADRGCASPKFCVMVIALFFHENRSNNDLGRPSTQGQTALNRLLKVT